MRNHRVITHTLWEIVEKNSKPFGPDLSMEWLWYAHPMMPPPFHEYLLMICKYTPSNLPSLTVSNVKYNGMFKESWQIHEIVHLWLWTKATIRSLWGYDMLQACSDISHVPKPFQFFNYQSSGAKIGLFSGHIFTNVVGKMFPNIPPLPVI